MKKINILLCSVIVGCYPIKMFAMDATGTIVPPNNVSGENPTTASGNSENGNALTPFYSDSWTALMTELAHTKSNLSQVVTLYCDEREQHRTLLQKYDNLSQECSQMCYLYGQVQGSLASIEKEFSELKQKYDNKVTLYDQLQKEKVTLEEEKKGWEKEKARLEKEIANKQDLEQKHTGDLKQIATLEEKIEAFESRKEELKAANQTLQTKVETLENQINSILQKESQKTIISEIEDTKKLNKEVEEIINMNKNSAALATKADTSNVVQNKSNKSNKSGKFLQFQRLDSKPPIDNFDDSASSNNM